MPEIKDIEIVIKPYAELKNDELLEILALRQQVFMLEQNSLFKDIEKDQQAIHCFIKNNDAHIIAYLRYLLPTQPQPWLAIQRVCVAVGYRDNGLATSMLSCVLNNFNKDTLLHKFPIRIEAQSYLKLFYSKLGFKPTSEPYDDAGVEHINMEKTANSSFDKLAFKLTVVNTNIFWRKNVGELISSSPARELPEYIAKCNIK